MTAAGLCDDCSTRAASHVPKRQSTGDDPPSGPHSLPTLTIPLGDADRLGQHGMSTNWSSADGSRWRSDVAAGMQKDQAVLNVYSAFSSAMLPKLRELRDTWGSGRRRLR